MPFFALPSGASPVLAGNAAPTGGVGNAGDLFIDRTSKILYGPKDAVTGWPTDVLLRGVLVMESGELIDRGPMGEFIPAEVIGGR